MSKPPELSISNQRSDMGRRRIGYWLKEGKAKRINIFKIEEILNQYYNCDLVFLNGDAVPDVDVIFHKMSDLLFDARCGKKPAVLQLDTFVKYFEEHTHVQIFDPLDNMKVLLDRISMYQAVEKCSHLCPIDRRFYSSGYYLVETADHVTISQGLENRGFTFPIMCKSRIAQGVQGHDMTIIFNKEGLGAVQDTNVIVPFIDHEPVLYKVFVVGDKYHVVTRPSITLDKLNKQTVSSYNFHSDTVSKVNLDSTSKAQEDLCSKIELNPLAKKFMKLVPDWVQSLRKGLNLSLFGFDLLFEKGSDRPYIIDVNYFPGYDGFANFHEILCEMLYNSIPCNDKKL